MNIINGIEYEGSSIIIVNGEVWIDGVKKENKNFPENVLTIEVRGRLESLKTDANVNCDNVGSVEAGGSVNCDDVKGNVTAGGSVNCDDVGGCIQAGGSVRHD